MLLRVYYWHHHANPGSGRDTRSHGFVRDERRKVADVEVDSIDESAILEAIEEQNAGTPIAGLALDVEMDSVHEHQLADVEVGTRRRYVQERCECGFRRRKAE